MSMGWVLLWRHCPHLARWEQRSRFWGQLRPARATQRHSGGPYRCVAFRDHHTARHAVE